MYAIYECEEIKSIHDVLCFSCKQPISEDVLKEIDPLLFDKWNQIPKCLICGRTENLHKESCGCIYCKDDIIK